MPTQVFFQKHKHTIIFFCIFLLGIFLRLYQIKDRMPWEPDGARDVLVAKLFTQNPQHIWGPESAGARGLLQGSPVYYWIVSLFWLNTKNPLIIVYFYSLIDSLGILLAYLIGIYSKSTKFAILFASLVAISPVLIIFSKSIWQPTLLSTLTLFNIFSVIKAQQNRKWLIILANTIFLPIHISFSYLHFAFVEFGLLMWILIKYYLKKPKILLSIATIIIFHLLTLLFFTRRSSFFDQQDFFLMLTKQFNILIPTHNAIVIWEKIMRFGFLGIHTSLSYLISLIIPLILGYYVFFQKTQTKLISIFLLSHIASLCIVMYYPDALFIPSYPEPLRNFRLIMYAPIIYGSVALIITSITNKYLQIGLGAITTFFLLFSTFKLLILPPTNQYTTTRNVVSDIYNDYKTLDPDNTDWSKIILFSIEDQPEQAEWYTAQYWFHLEDITNTSLVGIKQNGNSIQPLASNPQYAYLICPELPTKINITNDCSSMFSSYITNFGNIYSVVFDSIQKISTDKKYSLFRFTTKNTTYN